MSGREYFVIDGKGFVSSCEEDPEAFATLAAARKRARELARSEPGHTVVIAMSITHITHQPPREHVKERKLQRKRKPHAKSAANA